MPSFMPCRTSYAWQAALRIEETGALHGPCPQACGSGARFRFDFPGTAGARGYPNDAIVLLQGAPFNWPVAALAAAAASAPAPARPALAPPAPTPPVGGHRNCSVVVERLDRYRALVTFAAIHLSCGIVLIRGPHPPRPPPSYAAHQLWCGGARSRLQSVVVDGGLSPDQVVGPSGLISAARARRQETCFGTPGRPSNTWRSVCSSR
jgi:hypothetical protein